MRSGFSARRIWISSPGRSLTSCRESSDTAEVDAFRRERQTPGPPTIPGSPPRKAASASSRSAFSARPLAITARRASSVKE